MKRLLCSGSSAGVASKYSDYSGPAVPRTCDSARGPVARARAQETRWGKDTMSVPDTGEQSQRPTRGQPVLRRSFLKVAAGAWLASGSLLAACGQPAAQPPGGGAAPTTAPAGAAPAAKPTTAAAAAPTTAPAGAAAAPTQAPAKAGTAATL